MEWPEPVTLAPGALEKLTGNYALAPGISARVYLHEGRLFALMPGEGEAELFARSPSDFYLRVDMCDVFQSTEQRVSRGLVISKLVVRSRGNSC